MQLTESLVQDVVQRERAWCSLPRTVAEERATRVFLESIEGQRLIVPELTQPPTDVVTLIESATRDLDESRSASAFRTSRRPGSFPPKPHDIREDGIGVGTGSQDQLLALPDDQARAWTAEGDGAFRHAQHGALHLHQNGTWTHLKGGRIAKRGSGQQSLTEYVENLATGHEGPAGTSVEAAEGDVHHRLRAALLGEPTPVPLQEGAHVQLARALGHDGHVVQESDKDTAVVKSENIHARLARALRGY